MAKGPFKMKGSPVKQTKIPGGKKSKVQQAKFGFRQGWNLPSNLSMGKGFSNITRLASKAAQIGSRIVKTTPAAIATGFATKVFSHGIKNIKSGKAKIPKGYYKKGGKGYQKRDYSKKFNFGG